MSIFVHKVYYPWHSGPCEHEYDVSRYAIIKNPYQQHIVFLWTKTTKIKCLPTPWTESSDYYLQFGVCIISSFSMNNLMYQALVPLTGVSAVSIMVFKGKSCYCSVACPIHFSNSYLNRPNHLQCQLQGGLKPKERLRTLISNLVPSTSIFAHCQKIITHKEPIPVRS